MMPKDELVVGESLIYRAILSTGPGSKTIGAVNGWSDFDLLEAKSRGCAELTQHSPADWSAPLEERSWIGGVWLGKG